MKLRKLEEKDAPYMLEWMHDEDVCEFMQRDFKSMTLANCKAFIQKSQDSNNNLHMAIVDDNDEYMGTVSLKDINYDEKYAEFAITVRKCAMGKGFSGYGMAEIIRIGLEKLQLNNIFWCVSKANLRANRFYDKNGYQRLDVVPQRFKSIYPEWNIMNWYVANKVK